MKKRCFITICWLLALPAILFAQTAERIEDILEVKAVTYGQATQFVLEAAELWDFIAEEDAFRVAEERRWLPRGVSPQDEASLAGIAFLIMKAFDMSGGLMYSLFDNPHFAYRELVYQNVIQGRVAPNMVVPGDYLLFMVNRLLAEHDEPWVPVERTRDQ